LLGADKWGGANLSHETWPRSRGGPHLDCACFQIDAWIWING
jgi:hypothetical protein